MTTSALEKKSLERLEKLSSFCHEHSKIMAAKQKSIEAMQDYLEKYKTNKFSNYPYSKIKTYLYGLASIYFEMTLKNPSCERSGQGKYEDGYEGEFIDFLHDSIPLIVELNTKTRKNNEIRCLVKDMSTIGKHAYEIVHGYTENDYQIVLFTEENILEQGVIYINFSGDIRDYFEYKVIDPEGRIQSGKIETREIIQKPKEPITIQRLKKSKDAILNFTSKRGHTFRYPPFSAHLKSYSAESNKHYEHTTG